MVAGVAALLGSIAWAVESENYLLILGGVAGFFVCAYLSAIALHPSLLNIAVGPETLAGEELIGVLMFLLKALLRLAPVAFGAGVVGGTVAMGVACYLAAAGEVDASMATADTAWYVLIHSAALPLVAVPRVPFRQSSAEPVACGAESARQARRAGHRRQRSAAASRTR